MDLKLKLTLHFMSFKKYATCDAKIKYLQSPTDGMMWTTMPTRIWGTVYRKYMKSSHAIGHNTSNPSTVNPTVSANSLMKSVFSH